MRENISMRRDARRVLVEAVVVAIEDFPITYFPSVDTVYFLVYFSLISLILKKQLKPFVFEVFFSII